MLKNRWLYLTLILFLCLLLKTDYNSHKIDEQDNKEKIAKYEAVQDKVDDKIEKEDEYIGYISIPTIGLKRGFYSQSSSLNDVDKNIEVIADEMDNLLILAAHRGNSKVAYFKNLYKLSVGDEIILDYRHRLIHYRLAYKYYEKKDGNLAIRYDNKESTLVLITCVKELKDQQVVYIAYKIH